MDGLFVNKDGAFIEKASKHAEDLSLIAKGDGMEVMIQKIKPGEVFAVSPGDDRELMEFFYILEGEIAGKEADNGAVFKAGDSFYVRGLRETVYFRTLEPVVMIYMSTRPVFHLLSDEIAELVKISRAIEAKDTYTYDHDARLRQYALKIAMKIRLSKDRLEGLIFAALYHDLGKINVSEAILNKPGRLTPDEFELIKKHPTDGRLLLEKTYLKDVGAIIEQHHERLDGSGYPKGLKGEEILLEARIIAVADSFDAMTSFRSYRRPVTNAEAIAELRSLVDVKYDRAVVDMLEAVIKEEGKL
jgi:HD-GYP domain-containing protein (c-di-GMP phosphodiesterase class II)